jgi:predicted NUDIX family phosphoesterase
MATSKAGRVLMVAVVSHNLRRGKVLDVDDPFCRIWYVLTRSEHRVLLWKRVGTGSIEAIV